MNPEERIQEVFKKIDALQAQINGLKREVSELRISMRSEADSSLAQQPQTSAQKPIFQKATEPEISTSPKKSEAEKALEQAIHEAASQAKPTFETETNAEPEVPSGPTLWEQLTSEDFIGGNLISKIGVLILIIGLGIFVKYAIDENLISPLGRLLLAYGAGAALIGLSYWLKPKYKSYSAVLLSGGVATLYFTTFIGNTIFGLLPQGVTFGLMFICTVYTIYEAIRYDEEIIGIVGLVGAYCVPILLSDGGGKVAVLFGYMSLLNVGVLVLAFRKDWQRMNGTAFWVSWLVFGTWMLLVSSTEDYWTASIFNLIFFATFYADLLVYPINHRKSFGDFRLFLVLLNALLFYGIGWSVHAVYYEKIDNVNAVLFRQNMAWFTLLNFMIHGAVALYLFFRVEVDKQIRYSTAGLAILALTLAIPIYFQGEWMTVWWTLETVLLFTLTKRSEMVFFRQISYILTVLTTLSIAVNFEGEWLGYLWLSETLVLIFVAKYQDFPLLEKISWGLALIAAISFVPFYGDYAILYYWLGETLVILALAYFFRSMALRNVSLALLGLSVLALLSQWSAFYFPNSLEEAFGLIINDYFLSTLATLAVVAIVTVATAYGKPFSEEGETSDLETRTSSLHLFHGLAGLGILLLYGSFFVEIHHYFSHQANLLKDQIYFSFRDLYLVAYSFTFVAVLAFFFKKFKLEAELKAFFLLVIHFVLLGALLRFGFPAILSLVLGRPAGFLYQADAYAFGNDYHLLRLWVYLAVSIYIWFLVSYFPKENDRLLSLFHITANVLALSLLSLELYSIAALSVENIAEAQRFALKTGFTLLWGTYALGLIAYGIWQKRRFLRLTGFALIALTLAKIFLRDINYASTLQTTLALIGMGILLLLTAFLYQKYKDIILAEDAE